MKGYNIREIIDSGIGSNIDRTLTQKYIPTHSGLQVNKTNGFLLLKELHHQVTNYYIL